MSDISRQGSPRIATTSMASSPNRPSPLSRPHWPYSTYSHSHRPSSSSSSVSGSSITAGASQGWDYRGNGASTVGTLSPSGLLRRSSTLGLSNPVGTAPDDNTRHWSFTAFEWIVRDVHRLRDYVENTDANAESAAEAVDFDVLRESPMLGDGKFKLEIAYKPPVDATAVPDGVKAQAPVLSLFVTSVMLEYAHTDYEICSSMFTGIKCQDDRAGERGARSDWTWEFWQSDWTFREDSEVWECPLPSLSSLLENPRINETDSFVICVQIHSPVGPFFPQQPSAAYVPKELLDGLEALLDNANTGDVQFVCLERKEDMDAEPDSPDTADTPLAVPGSRRSSGCSSIAASYSARAVARKRIIYAHSDILIRRSEYFATMLNSSFSESSTLPGGRQTYTITVEEADFTTIYWLLKWVYANWLLFKEHDNPKAAIDGVGAGWSAKWLDSARPEGEWGWTTFSTRREPSEMGDARSVASAEGASTKKGKGPATAPMARDGSSAGSSTSRASSANSTAPRPSPSPARRAATTGSTTGSSTMTNTLTVPIQSGRRSGTPTSSPTRSRKDSLAAHLPPTLSLSPSATTFPLPPTHYPAPVSPHSARQPGRSRPPGTPHGAKTQQQQPDPHPHPCPPPPPASALSMYQVAHRYGMPGLAGLSLEHMMSTITPHGSFALLLASAMWDELHKLVEDYVVEKWEEVSVSNEFELCCQEVAAGEWGTEGGKTLTALFRRLRAPR